VSKNIDNLDKKILTLLCENPETSQVELAKRLKVSQPAISARIKKLQEKGILKLLTGAEIKKAELFLAKIDIATTNIDEILNILNKCPLYFNGFLISGKYNLMIFLMGENIRSIMSCVDSHIRLIPSIKEMEFNLVITPIREFVVPIKPIVDKKTITPCQKDCSVCTFYINTRCLGCPASIHYKGCIL
jgi:DNA-binding Lrp family transcriptional regulator